MVINGRADGRRMLSLQAPDQPVNHNCGPVFICPVCGYTVGGDATDSCPVCGVKKDKFVKF